MSSREAIAHMTGFTPAEVEAIRGRIQKDAIAQDIVDNLYGHDSLAASNPKKTIRNLQRDIRAALESDASDETRQKGVDLFDWIWRKGGRNMAAQVLLWK
jgi:hypothetical protein